MFRKRPVRFKGLICPKNIFFFFFFNYNRPFFLHIRVRIRILTEWIRKTGEGTA